VSPHLTLTIILAGLAVGVLYGIFGVGSAFATPMLSIIGVPGLAAVSGPLPAMLPGSATGAWSYVQAGNVDWRVAKRSIIGAVPASILGAIASQWVGGPALIAMSGVVLFVVGVRVLRPTRAAAVLDSPSWADRHPVLLSAAAALVGFLSGLLANGGGFLLVPMFLLMVGLDMNKATGTSLVVATLLTVPTLVTRSFIGDIDWLVAGAFAIGMIPGTRIGALSAARFDVARLQRAFGVLLLVFAVWFLARELPHLIA